VGEEIWVCFFLKLRVIIFIFFVKGGGGGVLGVLIGGSELE
jgi:hypothetical protein